MILNSDRINRLSWKFILHFKFMDNTAGIIAIIRADIDTDLLRQANNIRNFGLK